MRDISIRNDLSQRSDTSRYIFSDQEEKAESKHLDRLCSLAVGFQCETDLKTCTTGSMLAIPTQV